VGDGPDCDKRVGIPHLFALCEEQDFLFLFLPNLQQRIDDNHFARSLPESESAFVVQRRYFVPGHELVPARIQIGVVADLPQLDEADEYLGFISAQP